MKIFLSFEIFFNENSFQFPQQFPQNNLNNNNRFNGGVNNRFNDGVNNNRFNDGVNFNTNNRYANPDNVNINGYQINQNDFNYQQNPYDAEYERKLRVETEKLRQFLLEIDKKHSTECTLNVAAQWNFETNVNEVTQIEAVSMNDVDFLSTIDIDLHHASHPIVHILTLTQISFFFFVGITIVSGALGKAQPNKWQRLFTVYWFDKFVFAIVKLNAQQRYSDYMRSIWDQIKTIDQHSIYDEKVYRQVKMLASIGPSALPPDQLDRVS